VAILPNQRRPERFGDLIGSLALLIVSVAVALVVPISGLCRMAGFELVNVHPIFEHEHVQLADHVGEESLVAGSDGSAGLGLQGLVAALGIIGVLLMAAGSAVVERNWMPAAVPARVRAGPPRRRV
jgi:hypothetical protein